MSKPSKKELEFLYNSVNMSTRQIATLKKVHHSTVSDWLQFYSIPRRSLSEANKNTTINEGTGINSKVFYSDWSKLGAVYKIPVSNLCRGSRQNITIPLPYKSLISDQVNPATVTLSLSDLHLGHSDFLPDTYASTVSTLKDILHLLRNKFDIKQFNIVLNGDIVSGREVYDMQFLHNILGKGHWQVFFAEIIMKSLFKDLDEIVPIKNVYLTKGNHEVIAENYVLYLKRTLTTDDYDVQYRSKGLILNVADPIGDYNIFFTHGRGYGEYSPVSPTEVRDLLRMMVTTKYNIERCNLGHTHWLGTNIEFDGGLIVDVNGGFQRWEKSHSQRPCGMIMYLYSQGECSAIPVRPNAETEAKEKSDPVLEYKNIRFAGDMLLKHAKDIEGINTEQS